MQQILIRLFNAAQITAEAVEIHRLMRPGIPEARGIRADFIRNEQLTVVAPELQLKIHQLHADFRREVRQNLVDFPCRLNDVVHFLARRKMQRLNMRDVDERVVHLAALQFQLDDGRVQLRASRQTDALRQRPRHAVAHLHGYRQNLTSLDKALPRVQPSQVVRRDAVFFQHFEELFANRVVDFALAQNPPALQPMKRHCLILEVHDCLIRIVGCVNAFAFSFRQQLAQFHRASAPFIAYRFLCGEGLLYHFSPRRTREFPQLAKVCRFFTKVKDFYPH